MNMETLSVVALAVSASAAVLGIIYLIPIPHGFMSDVLMSDVLDSNDVVMGPMNNPWAILGITIFGGIVIGVVAWQLRDDIEVREIVEELVKEK